MKLVSPSANMREYLSIASRIIALTSNRGTVYKLSVFSVFFIAKTCSAPEAPKNAIAVGNNTIGSTVKFLCKEGFFRLGRPFTSTCRSDGQWTKPNVSCVGECGKKNLKTLVCCLYVCLDICLCQKIEM